MIQERRIREAFPTKPEADTRAAQIRAMVRNEGAAGFALPADARVISMLTLLAIVALGKAMVFLLLIPFAVLGVALVVFSLIHHLGVIKNLETRHAVQSSFEALRKSARDFVRSIQKAVSDLWPK